MEDAVEVAYSRNAQGAMEFQQKMVGMMGFRLVTG